MPLRMEVGFSPGDFVLDGDPVRLPKKEAEPHNFPPMFIVANGWMDQDGTWHGGSLGPVHIVIDGDTALLPKKGAEPLPNFRPVFIVAKRLDASRCHLVWR